MAFGAVERIGLQSTFDMGGVGAHGEIGRGGFTRDTGGWRAGRVVRTAVTLGAIIRALLMADIADLLIASESVDDAVDMERTGRDRQLVIDNVGMTLTAGQPGRPNMELMLPSQAGRIGTGVMA